MKAIKEALKKSFFHSCLIALAGVITIEMLSRLLKTIPSFNKLVLDLLNQTLTPHLPDTEIWKTFLSIASWIIATFIFALVLLCAYTAFKKLTNTLKPDTAGQPPYEGYTWQVCFKSGVYQARINPDYEVDVMSGKLFPLAITKSNQLMPTAWKLVRLIKDNSPK